MDGTQEGKAPGSEHYLSGAAAWLVFVGLFLAILMASLDALVVSTALPTIANDLHQVNGVTFVVSAYLIASTIAVPIFARLSDLGSRRNVFVAGLVIFIAGSALAGLSQTLNELIFFRAVQGFGLGGLLPVAIALIAVLYPPSWRARMTGFLSGVAGIAIVLGPLLGSYILDVTTWRWVFYINLPIGIVGILVLLLYLGPVRSSTAGRFDLPGAALLAGWVGSLMFALLQVSDAGWAWTDPRVLGLLAAAVLLFAIFLVFELRRAEPLVPLRLFGHRVIAAAGGTAFFTGVILSSAITFLSVFVGVVLLHNGPNTANDVRDMIYFLAIPMILGAAISGPILSRVSYRTLIAPGLALSTVAALFFARVTATTPLWQFAYDIVPSGGLALPLMPLGFGLGFALAGVTIVAQNEAVPEQVGATVGLVRFLQSLGGAVGLSLLTAYQTWRYGVLSSGVTSPQALLDAIVSSYQDVFLVQAVVVALALASSLFLVGRISTGRSGPRSEVAPGGGAVADLER